MKRSIFYLLRPKELNNNDARRYQGWIGEYLIYRKQ